jgi:B9 domain-containing protein 1
MAQADPNNPQRFLPAKQDFIYGDRMELLRSFHPSEERPAPPSSQPQNAASDLYDVYKRPPSPKLDLAVDSYFYLNVTGQVEHAVYPAVEALGIKFDFVAGLGWDEIHVSSKQGQSFGTSQTAYKNRGSTHKLVWNFPFEVGFRSTNPKGWPVLVLSSTGPDALGRDVVRGYGNVHVPTCPGRHVRHIPLFQPVSASLMLNWMGICRGKRPELCDPVATLGKGQGREVTRMTSYGHVKVVFNVSQINMERFGYSVK